MWKVERWTTMYPTMYNDTLENDSLYVYWTDERFGVQKGVLNTEHENYLDRWCSILNKSSDPSVQTDPVAAVQCLIDSGERFPMKVRGGLVYATEQEARGAVMESRRGRKSSLKEHGQSSSFNYYDGMDEDIAYYYDTCDVEDDEVVEYIAGQIEKDHPTQSPEQFNSLMQLVASQLYKIDRQKQIQEATMSENIHYGVPIQWGDFNEFNEVLETYLPQTGEGETMATQAATALCKLVYKWFNDGDVYDNTYSIEGWANDISDEANWLHSYIPETEGILESIEDVSTKDEYTELLYNLCTKIVQADRFAQLNELPKKGSVYDCSGPFTFKEKLYCGVCGISISDDEDYRYGGMCRDCYEDSFASEDDDMYESVSKRPMKNSQRIHEMGRLSNLHSSGATARVDRENKAAAARFKRASLVTAEMLKQYTNTAVKLYVEALYHEIDGFVKEVNEDAQNKITTFYSKHVPPALEKKHFECTVGFRNDSFEATFAFGTPDIMIGESSQNIIPYRFIGDKEVVDKVNAALREGKEVKFVYPAGKNYDKGQYFEFENYEPMALAAIWDTALDLSTYKPAVPMSATRSSIKAKGLVIAKLVGKDDIKVVTENVPSTDMFFNLLEQDTVFSNWLMTGEYDPMYDEESGEYLESRKRSGTALTEDALDDFDTDGEIAKANEEAMSDHDLQEAIEEMEYNYYSAIKAGFSDFLTTKYGLVNSNSYHTKVNEFNVDWEENLFGGSKRIGTRFFVKIRFGEYYDGIFSDFKKLKREDRILTVEEFLKEICTYFNETVWPQLSEEYPGIPKLEKYDIQVVTSSGQMERCAGLITMGIKITEEGLALHGQAISESRNRDRKTIKESSAIHAGMTQITSEEELKTCLDNGTTVYCTSTGAFGEDEGAVVTYFGPIEQAAGEISVDESDLEEFGYESEEDYIEDFTGTDVVILDATIGQGDSNFYMLDGYSIEDCDLWVEDGEI